MTQPAQRDTIPASAHPDPNVPASAIVGPTVGLPAPPLGGPSTVHQRLDLDQFAGKVPMAITFLVGLTDPRAAVAALDEAHIAFGHARVQLIAVLDEPIATVLDWTAEHKIPVVADPDRSISDRYVIPSDAQHVTVVAVDLDSVVVAVTTLSNGPRLADELAEMVVEAPPAIDR